ncbi:hypothetical protein MNEG_10303 [Monoraphidium neglectum]|uniref:N-acetyltransferase domain-containing protein n=1 Tax=Monoraphidium neglectum TaxID=145388 RepID=A0A0D2M9L7_9CHLO|nr:hypothetical protein MNEG_10303 [Monoraphidium neglectum]KIY97661.1 hypothetical protein MNEG_10303 [Monoraphidium neglectum]|eukprot:XP_013896681.1 hypothetical protein MNEG_10303 [Monoraphidium neglectum]
MRLRSASLVTAEDQRRRGNAAALLGELHSVLQGAGLQKVVAIIAEDTDASRAARDRLLKRRFGYRDLDIEQLVAWRAELPEYNKSLVGGFTLLERPLGAERRR